jgi:pyruvate dehydrogenase E1 component alpha subunit
MEVYRGAKKAVETAHSGNGPTLLECMTYRWLGHVGPCDDLDKGLRSKEELDCWKRMDPIKRFGKFLLERGIMSELERDRVNETVAEEIEEAVTFARESPYPDETELLSGIFKPK